MIDPKNVSDDVRRLNPDLFRQVGEPQPRYPSPLEKRFIDTWEGPEPEREYQFHDDRRWRFDFAWPAALVAVEVEGGIYNRGRHVRASGFMADARKYAEATLAGWAVFRLTSDMITPEWLGRIRDYIVREEAQA